MSPRRTPAAPRPLEAQARFEAFLRSRKLKLTRERLEIVEAVFSRRSHFDAEQLHAGLNARGKAVSRATVYRTLDLLVQCGLAHKASLGDPHAHYEAARENEHHDHLICLQCGKVMEFFDPDLEEIQNRVCTGRGFHPLHHSLQVFGLCPLCEGKADAARLRNRLAQIHT